MTQGHFSDDGRLVWLTPATSCAARALLNWEPIDLQRKLLSRGVVVPVRQIRAFEEFGVVIERRHIQAMLDLYSEKVEFSTDEERPGVLRKEGVAAHLGPGRLVFDARRTRRPKL